MVNLTQNTVKKIRNIEKKADSLENRADKKAEAILSKARSNSPEILKQTQVDLDKEKAEKTESAKKRFVEDSSKKIEEGKKRIMERNAQINAKLEKAAEHALDLFVKKIKELS